MIKHLLVVLLFCFSAFSQMKGMNMFPQNYDASDVSGISILDVKELSFSKMNGIAFTEISALAYDQKRGLYALSDKGNVFRLELQIKGSKIQRLTLLDAFSLKTKKGNTLKKNRRDSEGLALSKKGLIVSFERKPQISLFNFEGIKLKNYPLNERLQDIDNYQGKNKALEGLAKHPDFGLITAPETPLKGENKEIHTLYSENRKWKFKASAKITSIEVMQDKNLLVLEREFHLLKGHTITLSKVDIMNCPSGLCPRTTLASLKSSEGWNLDNFEGITHIKDNIYLMISDDNGSVFQKCILVLFEIKN